MKLFLYAALFVCLASVSASAGAYMTGEGHGYASETGTRVLPAGTIIQVAQPAVEMFSVGGVSQDIRSAACAVWRYVRRSLTQEDRG